MGWPNRQVAAWAAWLRLEEERPTVLTEYLVHLIAEVRRSWVKKPAAVKPEHCRLKFAGDKAAKRPASADVAKAVWMGRVGLAPKKE